MKRYYLKYNDMYVLDVSEDGVELSKNFMEYGWSDNLDYVKKQQETLEKVMGGKGKIYQFEKRKVFNEVSRFDLESLSDSKEYYCIGKDGHFVYSRNDYDELTFSRQRHAEYREKIYVERVFETLQRYGFKGYNIYKVEAINSHSEVE